MVSFVISQKVDNGMIGESHPLNGSAGIRHTLQLLPTQPNICAAVHLHLKVEDVIEINRKNKSTQTYLFHLCSYQEFARVLQHSTVCYFSLFVLNIVIYATKLCSFSTPG